MAKVFGGRWQIVQGPSSCLGEGAQGFVYRVDDLQGGPQMALKRLKTDDRADRFRREIEALVKIEHPNVINIVDYSRTEIDDDSKLRNFFVMPIASNGNLRKRVNLYKDDLDGTIQVALGLAHALEAAHGSGYVHRDVKPENILFADADHHVWLSDFGICHNIESERLTKTNDVMGPRGFTAPELESGSSATDPSCDLYSLGKVIYFMISGGTVIGREHLPVEFQALGGRGERYRLLQILVARLVTTLEARIKKVSDVIGELTRIKEWERNAVTIALNSDAIATINKHQQASVERQRINIANEKIREDVKRTVDTTSTSMCEWLTLELQKFKSLMSQSGTYKVAIHKATWNGTHYFGSKYYHEVSGVEVVFIDTASVFPVHNVLKFFICKKSRMQVTIGNQVHPAKYSDPEMAVIPYFIEHHDQQQGFNSGLGGFLRDKDVVEKSRREFEQRMGRGHAMPWETAIAKTFVGPPVNLMVEFRASEWPSIVDRVATMYSKSIKTVVEHAASDSRSTGP